MSQQVRLLALHVWEGGRRSSETDCPGPWWAYLGGAHLEVVHGLWALFTVSTGPVGPHVGAHHLSVSHHEDAHRFPRTHLHRGRLLAYAAALRTACHLYCRHTNGKTVGTPRYYGLGGRGVEPCSVWSRRELAQAVAPGASTGADFVRESLLRTSALLPRIQCMGRQLLLPRRKDSGFNFWGLDNLCGSHCCSN